HVVLLSHRVLLVFHLLLPHPPSSPLFPYTTLFRSHRSVAGAERAKDVRRLVAAAVVHEDDLVRPGDLLERPGEPPMEGIEALRLVEHRNHHRQCRTHSPAHRSTSRTSRQSLWPPKPNEFEMAARMRAATAVFGT